MTELVLDSWPIMAWLKRQPAAARVDTLLQRAARRELTLVMNIVNVGEIFYLSAKIRNFRDAQEILQGLRSRVTVVPAGDELVLLAATLKARNTISYADGFAAATAIVRGVPLATGDEELKALAVNETGLQIEWLG